VVAVWVFDKCCPRTRGRLVPWLFDDAVVVDSLERFVHIIDFHRDMVVLVALLARFVAVRIRKLELDAIVIGNVDVSRLTVFCGEFPGVFETEFVDTNQPFRLRQRRSGTYEELPYTHFSVARLKSFESYPLIGSHLLRLT